MSHLWWLAGHGTCISLSPSLSVDNKCARNCAEFLGYGSVTRDNGLATGPLVETTILYFTLADCTIRNDNVISCHSGHRDTCWGNVKMREIPCYYWFQRCFINNGIDGLWYDPLPKYLEASDALLYPNPIILSYSGCGTLWTWNIGPTFPR